MLESRLLREMSGSKVEVVIIGCKNGIIMNIIVINLTLSCLFNFLSMSYDMWFQMT